MARLLQLLTPDRIVAPLTTERKKSAIREVASHFEGHPGVPDLRRFLSAVFRQESHLGSGVDHGVALPHCRDACILEPVVGMGVSEAGVDWDDGRRVNILVLVGWPEKHDQAYLQTIAELARLLRQQTVRQQLPRCPSPRAVWDLLQQDSQPSPQVS